MASAISKRQQARNERILQDLIRSVPGNDRCADCAAKNPGWASWNLGVFLCMRCAGLHRKLGTHVSKVKSLSMDSWSSEQVDNMKKLGNVESNRKYNPKGVRPDIPIDADEVDAAIEKFIRQKYEQRTFSAGGPVSAATRQNTGSTGTGSWNEEPPPLPPKPGKKFGFSLRSASSTLPRAHKHDRNFTPPLSPTFSGSDRSAGHDPPSPREVKPSNKASQLFGMKITSVSNNFDAKLATLRDMGFSDNRRNSEVLKSTNGSLDRAVEALVRMGEGSNAASRSQTLDPRTLTPVSMGSQGVNGITFDKTRQSEVKKSSNPWEIREEAPQRAATQPLPEPPRSQSAQPTSNSWNPFLSQPQQPQQTLENSFQNLQVSQTGPQVQNYGQQQAYQAHLHANTYQPPSNPWDSINIPRTSQPSMANAVYSQQPQSTYQYQQPPQAPQAEQNNNPFLRRAASQTFTPSNPWAQPAPQQQAAPAQQHSNPFGIPWEHQQQQQPMQQSDFQQPNTQSPAPMFSQQEYFTQQGQPQTQQFQQVPQSQAQQPQQASQSQWPGQAHQQQGFGTAQAPHPFQQQMMPQQTGLPQLQQQYPQAPPQEQPWTYHEVNPQSQQPMRLDKSSILGLFNQPALAPQRSLQPVMEDGSMAQQAFHQQMPMQQQQQPHVQQRSVTMPMQNSMNPFGGPAPAQAQAPPQQGPRHVSNESVAFQGFAGDGRHSPDAFAGLSSRYMR